MVDKPSGFVGCSLILLVALVVSVTGLATTFVSQVAKAVEWLAPGALIPVAEASSQMIGEAEPEFSFAQGAEATQAGGELAVGEQSDVSAPPSLPLEGASDSPSATWCNAGIRSSAWPCASTRPWRPSRPQTTSPAAESWLARSS